MGKLFDDNGKLIDPDGLKSVRLGHVFHGDYCPSTGGYVAGVRDMEEQLKKKSDAMADRMGFDVNYKLADPADKKTLGVTTD